MLTGCYPKRVSLAHRVLFPYSTSGLNPEEITIADMLREHGYATGIFGKWHLGHHLPFLPTRHGFDEFYGFCSGHWGDYFSPPLDHNGKIVQGEGYVPDDITGKAIDFIEKHRNNSFFLYIPQITPHTPAKVPDEWWDKFKDKGYKLFKGEVKPNQS